VRNHRPGMLALALSFAAALAAPAPAHARQELPQESAASLIERAAYAEEHERDFSKALELYRQALDAARAAGDAARAEEAQDSVSRLTGSGRESFTVTAQMSQEGADELILERVAELMQTLVKTHPKATQSEDILHDLELFGDVAVPYLAEAATRNIELRHRTIDRQTSRFARVLSRIATPAADAALRHLSTSSSDPLVRRDVVGNLDPLRHRKLLFAALEDPVPSVREAAVGALRSSDGEDLVPIMLSAARAGNGNGVRWLTLHAPATLFGLLSDESIPASVRVFMLDLSPLPDTGLPADAAIADALLRSARTAGSEALRGRSLEVLARCFDGPWSTAPGELRAHVAQALAGDLASYPVPGSWLLLGRVGEPSSLRVLTASLRGRVDPLQSGEFNELESALIRQLGRLGPGDFPDLVAAFAELGEGGLVGSQSTRSSTLWNRFENALQSVDVHNLEPATVARGFEAARGPQVRSYLRLAAKWIDRRHPRGRAAGLDGEEPRLDPVLTRVARALATSDDESVRGLGARALGLIGDPEHLPLLLGLRRETYASSDAAQSIRQILAADAEGSARAIAGSIDAALARQGPDLAERLTWIEELPDSVALGLFEKYWPQATDAGARTALLGTLVDEIGTPQATAALLERYDDIPAAETGRRRSAIDRFGTELFEPAIPLIGRALRDPDAGVRQSARDSFQAFKNQRQALDEFEAWRKGAQAERQTVDELLGLLASKNPAVVASAVKALGALKAQSAYPQLIRLLERDDPVISAAVEQVIDALIE